MGLHPIFWTIAHAQIGASPHAYEVHNVQGLEKLQVEKIFALVQDRSSIIVIFHFS
jgi:hypothetical protein